MDLREPDPSHLAEGQGEGQHLQGGHGLIDEEDNTPLVLHNALLCGPIPHHSTKGFRPEYKHMRGQAQQHKRDRGGRGHKAGNVQADQHQVVGMILKIEDVATTAR